MKFFSRDKKPASTGHEAASTGNDAASSATQAAPPSPVSQRAGPESSHTSATSYAPRQPPALSINSSMQDGITSLDHPYLVQRQPRAFKSYRLQGDYVQPWINDKRLKKTKVGNWIVLGFMGLGFCISGYIMYMGAKEAILPAQCLIMEDHFEKINTDFWGYEIQTGNYGNGEFDWTTDDPKNSFVDAEGLHIVPTLTTETTSITESQLLNDYTLNITKAGGDGSCTSTDYKSCSVKSNSTLGTIIPPVRSARLTTKGKKSIKYGRVEIVAKVAKGDWLWPALWMMPESDVYGPWPASGEIDIAEFRGNAYPYPEGRDFMSSTLHWGPSYQHDGYMNTHGKTFLRRSDFSTGFHTFGLEWTESHLFMYLNNRLKQVMYAKFSPKKTLWQDGEFADLTTPNGTLYENPWKNGGYNAPFDEKFYLILNVAVGAQNGWFWDGQGKPWVDGSPFAARDFWNARNQWLPTWGKGNERGMTVKSVKMWQAGHC